MGIGEMIEQLDTRPSENVNRVAELPTYLTLMSDAQTGAAFSSKSTDITAVFGDLELVEQYRKFTQASDTRVGTSDSMSFTVKERDFKSWDEGFPTRYRIADDLDQELKRVRDGLLAALDDVNSPEESSLLRKLDAMQERTRKVNEAILDGDLNKLKEAVKGCDKAQLAKIADLLQKVHDRNFSGLVIDVDNNGDLIVSKQNGQRAVLVSRNGRTDVIGVNTDGSYQYDKHFRRENPARELKAMSVAASYRYSTELQSLLNTREQDSRYPNGILPCYPDWRRPNNPAEMPGLCPSYPSGPRPWWHDLQNNTERMVVQYSSDTNSFESNSTLSLTDTRKPYRQVVSRRASSTN